MFNRIHHLLFALKAAFKFDNPWQIIFSHAFYPKGNIMYVWHGNTMIVDGRRGETAGGLRCVLASTEYTQFFRLMNVQEVRNIMDLGANVGSFSVLSNRMFSGLNKVVIVEGDSTVLPRLEFNVNGSLPREKTTILQRAVCDHDGEITFVQAETSVGSGIASQEDTQEGTRIVVPAISLNSLLGLFPEGEMIDLCKMDIEGSEYLAIYSLPASGLDRIKFIITELHGSDDQNREFIKYLEKQGFTHIRSDEHGNPSTHGFQRRG